MNHNACSNLKTAAAAGVAFVSATWALFAASAPDPAWKIHDSQRPRPAIVDPGVPSTYAQVGQPPADAVILFNGTDLKAWAGLDGSAPQWIVRDGAMECVQGSGYIRTLQNFGDCQLHVEWAAPTPAQGTSQGRGNSGVFLMGLYEVQVLDSFQNRTYADGQAGSVYGQYPPLVNASRPPGEWQIYDIIFTRPRFRENGEIAAPARMTVLHNGVLVQNHVTLTGPTGWMQRQGYPRHEDKLPLSLQDHGNPVSFRNIWVRELTAADQPEFTYSTDVLDRWLGTYEVDDTMSIVITRKDSQLHMRLVHPNREHSYPLFAAAPDKFFAKTVDASVVFQASDGAVQGLTFFIGGDPRPAKKVR